jgi:hypothetical protein
VNLESVGALRAGNPRAVAHAHPPDSDPALPALLHRLPQKVLQFLATFRPIIQTLRRHASVERQDRIDPNFIHPELG